jgi:hypothetical protein
MDHIHNEAVLAFLQAHNDNPNVQRFLAKKKQTIEALNKELGTEYKDYFDYLEDNIGDDADFTGAVETKVAHRYNESDSSLGLCYSVAGNLAAFVEGK